MSIPRVEFVEVGRDKRSWVADTSKIAPDDLDSDGGPSADWLAREAKRGGRLMSHEVEVGGGDLDDLRVFAGMRVVGRCSITFPDAEAGAP